MILQDKARGISKEFLSDPFLENETYYPPALITKPITSNTSRVKETIYSLRNMQEINTLASERPVVDTRSEIFNEKKKLHEISLNKIKGWGNTIVGARNKRLAAANEKIQLAEAERKRLDDEWAAIAEQERQASLKRSRMMQKCEDSRFRSLHSQMLLSNVLMERDKQIEYKYQRAIADKIHEKEEVLKMRLQYLNSLEKEKADQEAIQRKRLEFAEGLKVAVDRKKAKGHESVSEREKPVPAEIQKELEQEVFLQNKKKRAEAEEIKKALAEQIQEKHNAQNELRRQAQKMEDANHRFNEMKNLLAEKRKEFTNSQAHTRIIRSDEVAKEYIKLNEDIEVKRQDFMKSMQKSNDAQTLEREIRKAQEKQQFLIDKAIFEQNHRAKKILIAEEEKLQKVKDRLHHIQQAQQWKKESLENAEKKRQILIGIKEDQIEQMKQYLEHKNTYLEEHKKHDAAFKAQVQKDNAEFDEYATSSIEEWGKQGKSIGPLLNILEKERPGYTKARKGPKELDHFSRLGFIGRNGDGS